MPAHNQSRSLWWRRATLMGAQRVVVVAIAVGACSAALSFVLLRTATPASQGITLPWWSAAAALGVVLLMGGVLLAPVSSRVLSRESRRRAERMEFLYHTNELLHSTSSVQERAGELLQGMSRMFGAARAELLLMPESRGAALHVVCQGHLDAPRMHAAELTYGEQETINLLRSSRLLSVAETERTSPLALMLAERGASTGTAVLLRGSTRPQGVLLLLDMSRGRTRLSPQEENLLLTVCGHVSVALENGQLAGAVRAITAERDELTRRVSYDPLTQVPNRSLFIDTLSKTLDRLAQTHRPVAVMFVDLDGFKAVNDTFGHAAGDQVLATLAARMRGDVRKLDMVARLGGDEFGVLVNGMRRPEDATVVAQRIVNLVQAPMQLGDEVVRVGGSVGIAVVQAPAGDLTPESLLHQADVAMYLAKRQGKGRFIVFDPASRQTIIAAPDDAGAVAALSA